MFFINGEWTTPSSGYTVTDSRRSSSPMDLSEPESDDSYQCSQYEAVSIMPSDKTAILESDDDTWILDDKSGEKLYYVKLCLVSLIAICIQMMSLKKWSTGKKVIMK